MKTRHLIVLCFLSTLLQVKADWVVVQTMENSNSMMHQTNAITTKFKGNKIRIDGSPYQSIIMDNDSGDQIVLIHPQKMVMVQTASQRKEGLEIMKQVQPTTEAGSNGVPKLIATGKSQRIMGYETKEFVWEGTGAKGRYWVTRDLPNYAALQKVMEDGFAETRKMSAFPLPDTKELPGFAVRSEQISTSRGQTMTNIVTLVSATEQSISDSEFSIPAGYSKGGERPGPSPTKGAAGMREILKQMEKKGLSEKDKQQFEQIIKNAEAEESKK